jgi:hypothetical protein
MGKTWALVSVAAALLLTLGSTTARAQDNLFALSHFSNAHTTGAPDGVLRLVNDGALSDSSPDGDLCAAVYVFDSAEELNECCACRITPNGVLSLSVNTSLTSNTLTNKPPTRGVVKVVSLTPYKGVCTPTSVTPQVGIRGWLTHPQKGTSTWSITEAELTDSTFGDFESVDLPEDCAVLIELGSGAGVCSCADTKQ